LCEGLLFFKKSALRDTSFFFERADAPLEGARMSDMTIEKRIRIENGCSARVAARGVGAGFKNQNHHAKSDLRMTSNAEPRKNAYKF